MVYSLLEGHLCLRERITLSIFSKQNILIKNIRTNSLTPGIRKFEIELFSLVDKITKGSEFRINENGTMLKFFPGNENVDKLSHYTGKYRSLSYYLEFVLYASIFRSNWLEVKLSGLRSSTIDISLETLLYVTIPLYRKLGLRDIRVKIFSNSFSKNRNTDLVLICSPVKLKTKFILNEPGILKKLRVIYSYSSLISFPKEKVKNLLKNYILNQDVDVGIYDFKIPNKNFFFQTVILIGETSTGCILGADLCTTKKEGEPSFWKEKIGQLFFFFFDDLKTGSCVDYRNQISLLMKLLDKEKLGISGIRIGKLTLSCIIFFRDVKKITGTIYKISPSIDNQSVTLEA